MLYTARSEPIRVRLSTAARKDGAETATGPAVGGGGGAPTAMPPTTSPTTPPATPPGTPVIRPWLAADPAPTPVPRPPPPRPPAAPACPCCPRTTSLLELWTSTLGASATTATDSVRRGIWSGVLVPSGTTFDGFAAMAPGTLPIGSPAYPVTVVGVAAARVVVGSTLGAETLVAAGDFVCVAGGCAVESAACGAACVSSVV